MRRTDWTRPQSQSVETGLNVFEPNLDAIGRVTQPNWKRVLLTAIEKEPRKLSDNNRKLQDCANKNSFKLSVKC